ncbi:MAG: hypothetical protein ACP5UU_01785 [Thermoprotei archaeon]
MNDLEELVSMLEAEVSSRSMLPLSKRQVQLIKRSLRRSDTRYAKILHELAVEMVRIRVEKLMQGSTGELTEDELRLESDLGSLFGGNIWIVQALEDFSVEGVSFKAGSLVSMDDRVAQSLITQKKVKLVTKIGDTGNHDEVLPQVQDIHSS